MTLPIGGLAFLDSNGQIPAAALPPGQSGITALTGDVTASGTGSVQATISQAIAASIAAASSNASTALAQIAALATVASTGSAASLTGTLAAARIADGSLPVAKLTGLATVATSGLASDLSGTLAVARLADASLTTAKLAAAAKISPYIAGQGMIAETFPRQERSVSLVLVGGVVYYTGVALYAGQVITNITVGVTVKSTSATLAKVGLYSKTGTRLALSSTQHVTWNANPGLYTVPFAAAATYTVPADDLYYVAVISVGGTPPSLLTATTSTGVLSITTAVIGSGVPAYTAQTAQSDLPSPGSITAGVTTAIACWAGLS